CNKRKARHGEFRPQLTILPGGLTLGRSDRVVLTTSAALMTILQSQDPAVFAAIAAEEVRQQDGLEMIASENYTSVAVMEAVGSVLTNKYAEGYPGRRYYGGGGDGGGGGKLPREPGEELFVA